MSSHPAKPGNSKRDVLELNLLPELDQFPHLLRPFYMKDCVVVLRYSKFIISYLIQVSIFLLEGDENAVTKRLLTVHPYSRKYLYMLH
jgi:hypothetical protein